jgi:hypothetical protein
VREGNKEGENKGRRLGNKKQMDKNIRTAIKVRRLKRERRT